ncbi:MAG: sigma-54 dependent transcriptional regulator [Candidatus Electryonea clarkiae]|nr:sigma-54 dependent transcriptional regulator [Candidatus Electryonea clarkiae]MDP8288376.1 sigma-54 dependent transcriptional regulator [Candidatus Electryonea clarkiae]
MKRTLRVLVVDDDEASRIAVTKFLSLAWGYDITECSNGEDALKKFSEKPFPIIMSDIRMPKMDGMELLRRIRSHPDGRNVAFILMTGFADKESAITALREGAYDYLEKPIDAMALSAVMTRLEKDSLSISEGIENYSGDSGDKNIETHENSYKNCIAIPDFGTIGVFSKPMNEAVSLALKFHDDRSVPVLIEGSTGTGKEVIARLVHHGRERNQSPFIPVNCSAIAPGLFESELFGYEGGAFTGSAKTGAAGKFELAQEGTIFLDEIGDMPLDLQPKLLRVLENRELYRVGGSNKIKLNIRIVAATNINLKQLVSEGNFRNDLYHRLNLGRIVLTSLRERKEEILPLARMFLLNFAQKKNKLFQSISDEAGEILTSYAWPGNIRELENVIERVVLLYDNQYLQPEHLAFLSHEDKIHYEESSQNTQMHNTNLPEGSFNLKSFEDEIIQKVLQKFDGNKSRAAEYLGISRNTLINRSKGWT